MNCEQVREHLPGYVHGDLEPAQRGELEGHLGTCAACCRERDGVVRVRELLDMVSAPTVSVDPARIYRETAAAEKHRLRRWRRVAVVVSAVAASLGFAAVALRLEVRVEDHQMVLRWGTPPPLPEPSPAPPAPPTQLAPEDVRRLAAVEDQMRLMTEIVHALAGTTGSAEARDRQRQREIAQLHERLVELQKQTAQRWLAVREYAEALFTAKLNLPKQGAIP